MLPPYRKLALISAIHLAVMFLLTYALIASGDHFYANINRVYMAILMVAPMVVIMLTLMRTMFPDAGLNRILVGQLRSGSCWSSTLLAARPWWGTGSSCAP